MDLYSDSSVLCKRGLEDEEDEKPLFGPVDNEYHLFEKDKGLGLGSLPDVDDLASIFTKQHSEKSSGKQEGPQWTNACGATSQSIICSTSSTVSGQVCCAQSSYLRFQTLQSCL